MITSNESDPEIRSPEQEDEEKAEILIEGQETGNILIELEEARPTRRRPSVGQPVEAPIEITSNVHPEPTNIPIQSRFGSKTLGIIVVALLTVALIGAITINIPSGSKPISTSDEPTHIPTGEGDARRGVGQRHGVKTAPAILEGGHRVVATNRALIGRQRASSAATQGDASSGTGETPGNVEMSASGIDGAATPERFQLVVRNQNFVASILESPFEAEHLQQLLRQLQHRRRLEPILSSILQSNAHSTFDIQVPLSADSHVRDLVPVQNVAAQTEVLEDSDATDKKTPSRTQRRRRRKKNVKQRNALKTLEREAALSALPIVLQQNQDREMLKKTLNADMDKVEDMARRQAELEKFFAEHRERKRLKSDQDDAKRYPHDPRSVATGPVEEPKKSSIFEELMKPRKNSIEKAEKLREQNRKMREEEEEKERQKAEDDRMRAEKERKITEQIEAEARKEQEMRQAELDKFLGDHLAGVRACERQRLQQVEHERTYRVEDDPAISEVVFSGDENHGLKVGKVIWG